MIRTFRKETGGYALLYVMVVIAVVAAIVMAICTTAVENYKAQQDSVSLMEKKYAVMGEVEKKLAILEEDFPLEGELNQASYKTHLERKGFSGENCSVVVSGEGNQYTVTITESSADNQIEVEVVIQLDILEIGEGQFQVNPETVIIQSYQVGAPDAMEVADETSQG